MKIIQILKGVWYNLRLHTQLSIFSTFAILITIFAGSYWVTFTKHLESLNELKKTMTTVSTGLSTNGMSAILANNFLSLEKQVLSSLFFDDVIAVQILDVNGKVLCQGIQGTGKAPQILYSPEFIEIPLLEISQNQATFKEDGELIEIWFPARSYELVGWIHLVASTKSLTKKNYEQQQIYFWLAIISAIVVSAAISVVIARSVVTLRIATQFAKDLSSLKGSKLNPAHGPREATELVRALNQTSEVLKFQQNNIDLQKAELAVSLDKLQKLNATLEIKISERTKDLQQANKYLSLALQTKGEFLANMSHEIRTPLNVIFGISSVLSELALGDEVRGLLKIQDTAGSKLLHVISDILVISKIEANALEFETIPFDVAELVLENVNLLIGEAESKGLRIGIETDKCKKCFYLGDPGRVGQVLLNLLNNAMKFTEKGEILVRASPDQNGLLKIEVHDTGIGIQKEMLEKIFEPFVQADSSITRRYGGTGLGLTISKTLVQKMGGQIWIESEPNKGSHFYFTLNLPKATEAEIREFELSKIRQQPSSEFLNLKIKRKILLVDDDMDNHQILKIYFKDYPIELITANNGEEALKRFQSENFDLILMDMQMPVMDGLTATRKIREIEVTRSRKKTPILILTANAFKENYDASLQAGADSFITKPIKKSGLLLAIEKYLI